MVINPQRVGDTLEEEDHKNRQEEAKRLATTFGKLAILDFNSGNPEYLTEFLEARQQAKLAGLMLDALDLTEDDHLSLKLIQHDIDLTSS